MTDLHNLIYRISPSKVVNIREVIESMTSETEIKRGLFITVRLKGSGHWHKGYCDFDSLDDLRSHLMGDNASLRLRDLPSNSENLPYDVEEVNVRCSEIALWGITY